MTTKRCFKCMCEKPFGAFLEQRMNPFEKVAVEMGWDTSLSEPTTQSTLSRLFDLNLADSVKELREIYWAQYLHRQDDANVRLNSLIENLI